MEEKATRTSLKQRLFIGFIAFLMLGSFVAVYIGIAVGGNGGDSAKPDVDENKVSELLKDYTAKNAKLEETAKPYSDKYFADFSKYKSETKGYNATSVNEDGLKTKDLKAGTGATITEAGDNYFAYYIGWCADESIFDSSLDNSDNPTALKAPLDPSMGLIEGWTKGVSGMKVGGIREISIPGELAYGEQQEICGGTNSPLKFIVMAIPRDEKLASVMEEANEARMRYMYYAQYGIDYDELMNSATSEEGQTEESSEQSNSPAESTTLEGLN